MENERIGVAQTLGMLGKAHVDGFDASTQWFHDGKKKRVAKDESKQRALRDRRISKPIRCSMSSQNKPH